MKSDSEAGGLLSLYDWILSVVLDIGYSLLLGGGLACQSSQAFARRDKTRRGTIFPLNMAANNGRHATTFFNFSFLIFNF
jgi:hypothetical protein